ncbi:RES domain-containing protein [Massilia sp. NEAU-DD11]|uniref:RES domain-containing protein n=1 Tax=Massilia cellulosiltytica TaxID=2683234 RepID=A0A7X3G5U6_9BURK|nr:RES family NAD+ phosphorylase [Telluria cellulosilytica]MVW64236.1 RES domain-containing protein [Telluria cellulosilytica]
MIHLWRIASDTRNYTADDITGAGAKATGGRWNRQGNAMLYTATNISLAVLETYVHIKLDGLPLNRYLVRLDVPDAVWKNARDCTNPPVEWDAVPEGMVSLDEGDNWLKQNTTALMIVPSVIVRDEFNVLVNPAHPDMSQISVVKVKKWQYDRRMFG